MSVNLEVMGSNPPSVSVTFPLSNLISTFEVFMLINIMIIF